MKQIQCSCGAWFFANFDDEVLCGKCRVRVENQRNENDVRAPVEASSSPPEFAAPSTVAGKAVRAGEDVTDAFTESLNQSIVHLRGGGGQLTASFFVVLLQNEDTGRSVVMLTTPNEERAGHLAAVIEKAIAGKNIGFRCRVEATAIEAVMPRRIQMAH